MGVPYLFRELAAAYPRAVRAVPPGGATPSCDRLWVDFNSIVHECARDAMASQAAPGGEAAAPELEAAIIAGCIARLDALTARFAVRQQVFVAVDGAPPRAKMHQQRQRRFMSRQAPPPNGRPPAWDTNAITPGTAFMDRLGAALHRHAAAAAARGPRLVVSDASEPGEGEQKMFARLRAAPAGGSDVVLGMDADLLLMCVAHERAAGLKLVREEDVGGASGPRALHVVDVPALRRGIVQSMSTAAGGGGGGGGGGGVGGGGLYDMTDAREHDSPRALVRDFMVLASLLGNDFLPPLPALRVRHGGLQEVVRAYHAARAAAADPRRALSVGGPDALDGVDPRLLHGVLAALAAGEGAGVRRLEAACGRTRARGGGGGGGGGRPPPPPAPEPPAGWMRELALGSPGWEQRYHRMVLRLGAHASAFALQAAVAGVCDAYLAGVAWSLAYLSRQACLSEGWYYPHAAAPCAADLARALSAGVAGVADRAAALFARMDADHRACEPALHLLMVLPPQSAGLLRPARLRRVMLDPALGAAHLYPERARLDAFLRERLHECAPALPPLRAAVVRAAALAALDSEAAAP